MKLLCAALLPAFALAQTVDLAKDVYPILKAKNCASCHVETGVASATRIHFPEGNSPATIDTFGKSLAALVNKDTPATSLLVQKPTNQIKHTGGRLILPGSKEEGILLAWAKRLAAMSAAELAPTETS